MKIIIESDMFDIVKRLKQIDQSYFVVYDNIKNRYEVWSEEVQKVLCFVVPFNTLDARTIVYANKTNSSNAQKIYQEIEKYNNDKVANIYNKIVDENSYKFKEIFNYEKLSKQMTPNLAYRTKWV